MTKAGATDDLIAVDAFLTRVFPTPKDSAQLAEIVGSRIFKPRRDADAFRLPARIDWEAQDRRVDRNWRMQLQGWMMFAPVMNAFDMGDDKAGAVAYFTETLADWWDHYGADADDIVTTRMPDSYAWYDMSVGFRALILAFFLNRIAAHQVPVTDAQRQLIEAAALKHIRHLAVPEVFSLNNHGIFQMHGLLALIETLPGGARFTAQRDYAISRMIELLSAQFDERGIHLEHSPHYHFYALKMFEGALASGWYRDIPAFTDRVTLAIEACKWLVDPLKRPICVGDSILTVQKQINFPDQPDQGYLISDFDASGYGVLRSGWAVPPEDATMVFLMGAYHATTHKHRDCLSFDWFDKGRRIICDGGKYGYKSDVYRHYALSYAAHNTIQFDGLDIIKMRPYGSAIEGITPLPGGIYRMTAALRLKAITHVRHLHIRPGHWMVIEDDLTQARSRQIWQRLHLDSDFQIQKAKGNLLRAVASDGLAVTIEPFGWQPQTEIHRGDEAPVQGHSFTRDLTLEPALQLTYTSEVQNARLLTVIALSNADRDAAHSYCNTHFGMPTIGPEPLPEIKAVLPNIPHKTVPAGADLVLAEGQHTYTIQAGGLALSFFAAIRPDGGARRLLVLLPGASARKAGHLDFQRHTWAGDYPGYDVVSVSDPSLKPDNDIGLAWFQNSADRFGLDALAEAILTICAAGNYAPDDMVIMGSSGGGFAAMMLASRFPQARIIAINPQLNLPKYNRTAYLKMLATCYPGLPETEVQTRFADRIRVTPEVAMREAPIFLFQNTHDALHVEHHLKPLLAGVDPARLAEFSGQLGPQTEWRALNVVHYDDAELGHSPPSRANTNALIAPILTGG